MSAPTKKKVLYQHVFKHISNAFYPFTNSQIYITLALFTPKKLF